MDMEVFLQKERRNSRRPYNGAAISDPRTAEKNFTDTRIFLKNTQELNLASFGSRGEIQLACVHGLWQVGGSEEEQQLYMLLPDDASVFTSTIVRRQAS